MAKSTTHYYQAGNKNFGVTSLSYNTDGTAKYEDPISRIGGMMSFDGTIEQTSESIPADDNPKYIVVKGAATMNGTFTFVHLSIDDYKLLFNNITDSNGVLTFGRQGSTKNLAVTFDNTQTGDDGIVSTNRFFLYNVVMDLPSISTETLAEGETNRRPFEVPFTASIVYYKNTDGSQDSVLMTGLNSVDNEEQFTASEDNVYIPDSESL